VTLFVHEVDTTSLLFDIPKTLTLVSFDFLPASLEHPNMQWQRQLLRFYMGT
jgi:hypothetical protein